MVVEGILGDQIIDTSLLELILTETYRANLWIGKDHAAKAVVIDALSGSTCGVFRRGFTL